MPRQCEVCGAPNSARIDRLLAHGEPATVVAELHGLSVQSVKRHRKNHLGPRLARAAKTLNNSKSELDTSVAPAGDTSPPVPYDPNLLQPFDLVHIMHQQFADLEVSKGKLKQADDARGVAVIADIILKHAGKSAAALTGDITVQPSDLIQPLAEQLLKLAEKHPAIKDDLSDMLLEIESAG